ncbi:unnamed protein product [Amoebophrya sp. A25]|nr:unnamed protein product [Amoebophrya sp. A25]|eukprot:GSA25T00013040001.1
MSALCSSRVKTKSCIRLLVRFLVGLIYLFVLWSSSLFSFQQSRLRYETGFKNGINYILASAQEVPWFVDFDCRYQHSSIIPGLRWSRWIGSIEALHKQGYGTYIDVLTSVSAQYIHRIDDALEANFDLRFPLGDECALGMLFYYSARLHWCFSQVREHMGISKDVPEQYLADADIDGLSEGELHALSILEQEQRNCWAASDAKGQMVEMFARWPMRVVLASKWPFVLFLMHEEVIRNARISRFWKEDPFINCKMDIGDLTEGSGKEEELMDRHRKLLEKNPLRSRSFYLETRNYTQGSGNFSALLNFFWDSERRENYAMEQVEWHKGVFQYIYQKDSDREIEACPHAFAFLILLRMQMCMLTESAYFVEREYNYAIMIRRVEMGDLIFSKWPVFAMLWSLKSTVRHDFDLALHLHELLDARSFVEEVSTQNLIPELNAKATNVDGNRLLRHHLVNAKKSIIYFLPKDSAGSGNRLDVSSATVPSETGLVEESSSSADQISYKMKFGPEGNRIFEGIPSALVVNTSFLEDPVVQRRVVQIKTFSEKERAVGSTARVEQQEEEIFVPVDAVLGDDEQDSTSDHTEAVTVRQKLWGGETPISQSLAYLSQRGSDLHRRVFSALARLPDIWWDDARKEQALRDWTSLRGGKNVEVNTDEAQQEGQSDTEKISDHASSMTSYTGKTLQRKRDYALEDFDSLPNEGLAFTVMVWGEKFSRYLEQFVLRFRETVKRDNLLVFAMDKVAYRECRRAYRRIDASRSSSMETFFKRKLTYEEVHEERKAREKKLKERHGAEVIEAMTDDEVDQRVRELAHEERGEIIETTASSEDENDPSGSFQKEMDNPDSTDPDPVAPACIFGDDVRTIVSKFTIPLLLAKYGLDSLWIDFDVYFVQDPTPHLLEARGREREILITGSFASHCICNGVVYFKGTDRVVVWLLDVINWMYAHPYEHDQKCFAHWLDHTERVTFRPLPRSGPVPQWALLESVQKFVTAAVVEGNGWMGNVDDIVLFHWLHGDSDGAGASGEWLRNSDFYKNYLGQLVKGHDSTTPITMMDIFFGHPESQLASPEMKLRALEASQQFERKLLLTETQHCGVMGELVTEHDTLKENLADKDKMIL